MSSPLKTIFLFAIVYLPLTASADISQLKCHRKISKYDPPSTHCYVYEKSSAWELEWSKKENTFYQTSCWYDSHSQTCDSYNVSVDFKDKDVFDAFFTMSESQTPITFCGEIESIPYTSAPYRIMNINLCE